MFSTISFPIKFSATVILMTAVIGLLPDVRQLPSEIEGLMILISNAINIAMSALPFLTHWITALTIYVGIRITLFFFTVGAWFVNKIYTIL